MVYRKPPYRCRFTGLQLSDIIKCVIAFCCGLAVKSSLDLTSRSEPELPSRCPSAESQDILRSDLPPQLREPYKPRTMYEVIRYEYFNSSVSISNLDGNPKTGLGGPLRADLKDILHQALALYNSGKPQQWTVYKLKNGYRRFDPVRGEEYMLDLVLENTEGPDKHREHHRFELVKPFGTAQLISDIPYEKNGKMIHFILPIAGMPKKFTEFMHHFEETCLKTQEHVYLMIIVFLSDDEQGRKTGDTIRNTIGDLGRKYRRAHIRIIQTYKAFSRAMGIDLGAKQLPVETLMFFCDVDVKFSQEFLNRCRLNTAQGKQLYYPIVFAQYKPEIVKKYSPADKVENLEDLNSFTGHWVHYGFGMACMYNEDYRKIGGFNTNIKGWGGEDVDLYIKHVNSNLKIVRAMDPGLVHIYHDKRCDPRLTGEQLRMCRGSQAEGIASKSSLALMVLTQNITSK